MSATKDLPVVDLKKALADKKTQLAGDLYAEQLGTTRKILESIVLSGENLPALSGGQATPLLKERPSATRQYTFIDELKKHYDIILVEATHKLYYKKKKQEPTLGWDDTKIYRIFPDYVQRKELMKAATNLPNPMRIDAREAKATAETMVDSMGAEDESKIRQYVDNAVVQITNNLFWDGHVGKLTDKPSKEAFRRLFDTTVGTTATIKWTEKQEAEWNSEKTEIHIKNRYRHALEALEAHGGKLPQSDETQMSDIDGAPWMKIPYIFDWADGNYDTYMDILNAIASCFLKNKIRGAYFLIGAGANGKSAFNNLLRTLFGNNNCAKIAVEQLNNAHKNMSLSTCIVNLPDEQKDIAMEHQELFKSITAHEETELDVLYSELGGVWRQGLS